CSSSGGSCGPTAGRSTSPAPKAWGSPSPSASRSGTTASACSVLRHRRRRLLLRGKLQPTRPPTVNEPRQPDARLIKEAERRCHGKEGHRIGSRRNDGCQNEQKRDGVGTRPVHQVKRNEAETDKRHHHNRQFKRQPEGQQHVGDEGKIIAHRPGRRAKEVLGV